MPEVYELKVSASSSAPKVASSIEKALAEGRDAATISIGAGALNQATKAIIIASGHLHTQGISFTVDPSFSELDFDGMPRTAIRQRLIVSRR